MTLQVKDNNDTHLARLNPQSLSQSMFLENDEVYNIFSKKHDDLPHNTNNTTQITSLERTAHFRPGSLIKYMRQSEVISVKGDEEMEDGRIRNRNAAEKIRVAWISKQIKAKSSEFTQYRFVRMFLGTWNVNAKGKDVSLESWLCSDWGANGEYSPDIVAVGFQEMVDLNAVNVAVDNKSSQRSNQWVERIKVTLNNKTSKKGSSTSFYLLGQKYLVGLLLCVFVKTKHRNRVKNVFTDSVGVGVMGMMGNKGGVSVRIQFYDSTICIVNSHLAAHRENVMGRNADFRNIASKLSYEIGTDAIQEGIRNGSLSQWAHGSNTIGMMDHDITFWMGDLNYRVGDEGEMSTKTILDLSEANELKKLQINDQLNVERAKGRVFQGFKEGVLNFPPTYKYQPGTDKYEQRPDKKLRAPAWCDRVLWSSQETSHVKQLTYERSELNISDHRPVMSTFLLTIKDVILEKRDKVMRQVMKKLDQYDNQTLPEIRFDNIHLDFGEVHYNQAVTLPITVENSGTVVALFRLVPKFDEIILCKSWMTISPASGMLIPGEKGITINFTLSIDNAVAVALNSGRDLLEDIIILRLENGRDYYITVTGKYARSCFGMSVDEAVRYTDPIRTVPLDPIKRVERYGINQDSVLCIPKELWRIVDAISAKGLHEIGLFTTPGHDEEIYRIRECLDTGAPFGEFQIHSMADILLTFLSSLNPTIVSPGLFASLEIDINNIQYSSRVLLDKLHPIQYNVFIYIISFFRECLVQQNGLIPVTLSRICCDCLVLGTIGQMDEVLNSAPRRKLINMIMHYFLETNSI